MYLQVQFNYDKLTTKLNDNDNDVILRLPNCKLQVCILFFIIIQVTLQTYV